MDSQAKQAPKDRAPFEISEFGRGTFRVTETKTGRAVFYGSKATAQKWLKELCGAYVRGVDFALGKIQDANHDRFERGEVLNGRNPRGDARLLGDLVPNPSEVVSTRMPLVSLGQGDYRHDVSPRDAIGGGR